MVKNFELKKESGIFEKDIRVCGFSSTKAICKKGFGGNSSILPRIKFSVGGQGSSPQSLSAHSLSRCSSV